MFIVLEKCFVCRILKCIIQMYRILGYQIFYNRGVDWAIKKFKKKRRRKEIKIKQLGENDPYAANQIKTEERENNKKRKKWVLIYCAGKKSWQRSMRIFWKRFFGLVLICCCCFLIYQIYLNSKKNNSTTLWPNFVLFFFNM